MARISILTDIHDHGYMGDMDYIIAFVKQGCLYIFIFMLFLFLAEKETKCFGTTYIEDLFIQGNDKLATDERIALVESIYNETVTAISYWLYGH